MEGRKEEEKNTQREMRIIIETGSKEGKKTEREPSENKPKKLFKSRKILNVIRSMCIFIYLHSYSRSMYVEYVRVFTYAKQNLHGNVIPDFPSNHLREFYLHPPLSPPPND